MWCCGVMVMVLVLTVVVLVALKVGVVVVVMRGSGVCGVVDWFGRSYI